MLDSPAAAGPPLSESRSGATSNLLTRLVREWPDAVARATIVAVALALFWLTWAHWGSIQIDCGRELYVPVQILHGKLLYRDIWFPHGPLASYIEALLVSIFGRHLDVFYLFGLTLAVACALLSLQLGLILGDRAAGLAAGLVLLFQGFGPSIFNYIFPYAYTAPLGLLLALLCGSFTIRYTLDRRGRNLIVAGLAAGMAILCKQEMGCACYILLIFVLVTEALIQRSARSLLRGIVACAPGVAIWMAVYGWFFWKLTPAFILFDNWQFVPGSYFMQTIGVAYAAAVGMRLAPSDLVVTILDAGLVIFLWCKIAQLSYRNVRRWLLAATLVFAAGAVSARYFTAARYVMNSVWALLVFPPGMFFIGCGFLAVSIYKLWGSPQERRLLAEATLAVFALVLSLRIFAWVKPIGYGVYYDIPLFLVFVITIGRFVRMAVPALSVENRRILINLLLATEVIMFGVFMTTISNNSSDRTARLRTSWGEIYLEPETAGVARQIIDFISAEKQKGRRVAVLPEGNMFYALTGTEAPSRWETIVPGVLSPRQEETYIGDLKGANVDYIVLTNRETPEYGQPYFGIDYDREIYRWIEANYRVIGEFGQFHRGRSKDLAALIYRRQSER